MPSLTQTTTQSKDQAILQELLLKHWMILNACHICKRTAGRHKKIDRTTFDETIYYINLFKCEHRLKVCNICLESGSDTRIVKLSKSEKKALKRQHNIERYRVKEAV